jgi:hypothetical protein
MKKKLFVALIVIAPCVMQAMEDGKEVASRPVSPRPSAPLLRPNSPSRNQPSSPRLSTPLLPSQMPEGALNTTTAASTLAASGPQTVSPVITSILTQHMSSGSVAPLSPRHSAPTASSTHSPVAVASYWNWFWPSRASAPAATSSSSQAITSSSSMSTAAAASSVLASSFSSSSSSSSSISSNTEARE